MQESQDKKSDNCMTGIGGRLRHLRELKSYTQKDLAELVGLSVDSIVRIERGETPSPGLAGIMRIAEALEVSVGEVIYGDDKDLHDVRMSLNPKAKWSAEGVEKLREILRTVIDGIEEQKLKEDS